MAAKFRKVLSPTVIFFTCVIILSVIVAVLSRPYFTEPVYSINLNKYHFASEHDNLVAYQSKTAAPIQVRIEDDGRTVIINHMEYYITKYSSNTTYNVAYPNGRNYEVRDESGNLWSFDENGNLVLEVFAYVNNQRIIQEGEEEFTPAMLVTAAYPEYHNTPGAPGFLFLALAILIYGWCSFRYKKFQDIMFNLSAQRLWVKDPEPSDFYYFMCKAGGILCMGFAIWVAIQAY